MDHSGRYVLPLGESVSAGYIKEHCENASAKLVPVSR